MPSTVIKSFAYDGTSHELHIVFQSGRRYTYQSVPKRTFEAMKANTSKGEYFNSHIRGRFLFVRHSPANQ